MSSILPRDASYGVIPLRRTDAGYEYLCLQHVAGHWDFPKGHPEGQEAPQETASRELWEETGLAVVKWLLLPPLVIQYEMTKRDGRRVLKTVTYFPALVEGEVLLQKLEVSDFAWGSATDTISQLTYENSRDIMRRLDKSLA